MSFTRPYREALRRVLKNETRGNGTRYPSTVDAIWAIRNRELDKANADRRFSAIITDKCIWIEDKMTRKGRIYSRAMV